MDKLLIMAKHIFILFINVKPSFDYLKENRNKMKEVEIREAKREDCKWIRKLIQELADFEKMSDGPKIDSRDLERDGFDSANPLFHCNVATFENEIIGYALYFYIYSTWNGKALHLEDLYVTSIYRRQKIGSKLLQAVAKKAVDTKCCRMDFAVLNWNPAKDFYLARGAFNLNEKEGWHMYRFEKDALQKLVADQ